VHFIVTQLRFDLIQKRQHFTLIVSTSRIYSKRIRVNANLECFAERLTNLLHSLVAWPRPDRKFQFCMVNILEASTLQPGRKLWCDVEGLAFTASKVVE
jgi:hypothetical protein